ncbi:MAG: hypothetical protein Q9191_004980 [Dirinaria sp. TL-2023a]
MPRRGTRAQLERALTTMDLEMSSPRSSVELLLDHDQPTPAYVTEKEYVPPNGGYANGLAAAGAPFGGIVYSLAISSMLEGSGPPLTFRILAICGFVANLIAIVLIRDRNHMQQPNQSAFNYRLLKRCEIWLVVGWGCLSELGYTILLYSLPNYARQVGMSVHQSSIIGALINLGLLIGRPATGYLSDTLGRINMATITTGLCGIVSLIVWIFSKSFGLLCFFAIVAGMLCGTFWATVAPVGADVAGLSEVPIAEPIGLALRSPTGDIYLDVQIFVGFMYIGASICNLFLRGWKISKTEQEAVAKSERERRDEGRGERQSSFASKEPKHHPEHRGLMFRKIFQLERV